MNIEELARAVEPTKMDYFNDSYLANFTSRVITAAREKGRSWYIVFENTAFHPKGGGQPTDTGTVRIAGVDGRMKKAMLVKGVVIHYVKLESDYTVKPGDPVYGTLDWANRYLYMRRHTAAHLLDHCLNEATGAINRTLSSWLAEPEVYVEYAGEPCGDTLLGKLEALSNHEIEKGHDVKTSIIGAHEVATLLEAPNAERLPETKTYRIVQINGFEKIPCGGTHVRNTREVMAIRLKAYSKTREGFKITFDVAR
jgi:Ser-tRNA(Ala) deacylase AlaX